MAVCLGVVMEGLVHGEQSGRCSSFESGEIRYSHWVFMLFPPLLRLQSNIFVEA